METVETQTSETPTASAEPIPPIVPDAEASPEPQIDLGAGTPLRDDFYDLIGKPWHRMPMPIVAWREWPNTTNRIEGKKGEIRWSTCLPQCTYRVEKIMAIDTAKNSGYGTRIMMMMVGQKLQGPVPDDAGEFRGGTLSACYGIGALGNGITFDECESGQCIRFLIYFEEDCAWEAALFGKAKI